MGNPRGFLERGRGTLSERAPDERVGDWHEFTAPLEGEALKGEASRCMDCGIPFCHQGCPLANVIPEWNDAVYKGDAARARALLLATNNFPEVTGRVCPAPCEASCVLNIEEAAVNIKAIEKSIATPLDGGDDFAPHHVHPSTGKRVAIVGSGPAGLACAQQLARLGHAVTVFEKDDRVGGLLRYGIPDFKLEKGVLDARLAQMTAEGVRFVTNVAPGPDELRGWDAVVLTCGARLARDLPVPGRELDGVLFAMDFLTAQNKRVAGDVVDDVPTAKGKRVVVIGGGDTGSDCVGTSHRHGAASVLQLEIMPKPPLVRMKENPWPEWPLILRTSSSQEEGGERDFAIRTTELVGDEGRVQALRAVRIADNTTVYIPCDLVLLAMGFTGPEKDLPDALGLARDGRGCVVTDASGRTNVPGVFAAGDMVRGQSLVVWAIADGRRVAKGVHASLTARMQSHVPVHA